MRTRISGTRVLDDGEMAMTRALQANASPLAFSGEVDTIASWSRRMGINDATLRNRINRGWPLKRALTEPVMRAGQRKRYHRNAQIIARMLDGFRSPASTGGQSKTFRDPMGTGAGRHACHLQSENLMD